jgi:S1-C subfamily serine protease
MNAQRPCHVLFVILSLALPTIVATEVAYAQKERPTTTARQTTSILVATEIARRTLPAVVMIECGNVNKTSQRSGFLVRPGIVVTNYHVIKDMVKGRIRVVGGNFTGNRTFRITAVTGQGHRRSCGREGAHCGKNAEQ